MSSIRISALLGIPEGAGIYGKLPAYSHRVADSLSAMLDDLITPHVLYQLAGAAAFQRGEAYFSEGAVGHLVFDDLSITARVQGTETYRVELTDDNGELAYDCDCTRPADGFFCKHCVAVGLAWLTDRARAADSGRGEDPWSRIRDYLAAQPAEDLMQLVLDAARRDEGLFQSLSLKARRGGDAATGLLREAIDQATTLRGHGGWAGAGDYVDGIERVVEALADLLAPGTAAESIDLAEYAIQRVESLLEQVDEEEEFNKILEDFCRLHLEAGKLEGTRTDDAVALYRRVVPPIVDQTSNQAYAEAAGLIHRIGALLEARQQAPEFVDYLIALRARYKAKRNFIKLLDGVV